MVSPRKTLLGPKSSASGDRGIRDSAISNGFPTESMISASRHHIKHGVEGEERIGWLQFLNCNSNPNQRNPPTRSNEDNTNI